MDADHVTISSKSDSLSSEHETGYFYTSPKKRPRNFKSEFGNYANSELHNVKQRDHYKSRSGVCCLFNDDNLPLYNSSRKLTKSFIDRRQVENNNAHSNTCFGKVKHIKNICKNYNSRDENYTFKCRNFGEVNTSNFYQGTFRPISTERRQISSSTTFARNSNLSVRRNSSFSDLPLEWWERGEECKEAKSKHFDRLDQICSSREQLIRLTTLWKEDTVLEPNMFPYDTPKGIEHYTLWSIYDMSHEEIQYFVDNWLAKHFPQVRRWQYDDNSGERSIDLFHVHVFIEMDPKCNFQPRKGCEYFPPHVVPVDK